MVTVSVNEIHTALGDPDSLTTERARDIYRAIRSAAGYDVKVAEWDADVRRRVIANPSPADWLRAAAAARAVCGRCAGTGRFVTYVENGIPKGPGGECFRCEGKGRQTWRDGARNRGYDFYGLRLAVA